MKRIWQRFLAYMHWDENAVCNESVGKGLVDYHDYVDDILRSPLSFEVKTCRRCGKRFTI